ncbi:MAG: hypothetical protein OSB03_09805, partial [Vicinamibacterales bacterium]|nr:hypothetical protein [Vicinamibacterales bacterium]
MTIRIRLPDRLDDTPEPINPVEPIWLHEQVDGGYSRRPKAKHLPGVIDRYAADRQHGQRDRSDRRRQPRCALRRQAGFRSRPIHGAERQIVDTAVRFDRQSLGRALLVAGRPQDAIDVYRRDLADYPRNGWSLVGLANVLRESGRAA